MLVAVPPSFRHGEDVLRIEARGHPAHTRLLEIELHAGADEPGSGYAVRGNILDLRKTGLVPLIPEVQNAGFIHHMQLFLRTGPAADGAVVEELRVEQPYVAMEASAHTGGEGCRDPIDRLQPLVGEPLAPGFEKHVTRLFGGPLGCSHLMTLAQTIGRTLPAAIETEEAARAAGAAPREPGERVFKRTISIDGLTSATDEHMEVVLQLSDLETAPHAETTSALARLRRQHEVQAHARIAMSGLVLDSLDCAERTRTLGDRGSAAWMDFADRSAELAPLVGAPVMPGLGRRLLDLLGGQRERAPMLDALLHLGPGFLQSIAAVGDAALGAPGTLPPVAGVGGNAGACYMWRHDGAIERKRGAAIVSNEPATAAPTRSEHR